MKLTDRILIIAISPLTLLVTVMFWWSIKVKGVDPKSGQQLYDYLPAPEGYTRRRKAGYWNRLFGKVETYKTKRYI